MTFKSHCGYDEKEFTIPDGFEIIGREVFRGCQSLTKITIPYSVTEIDDFAFLQMLFTSEHHNSR